MPKIHGLVYVIVGLFISIASWRLNYEKLIFFFYAGLIFIFVGIVKLIFDFIKRRTNKTEMHQKRYSQIRQRYCSKCGNVIRLDDGFCRKCGTRT